MNNFLPFERQFLPFEWLKPFHIETSQLICSVNQLTCFYMMGTSVAKRLVWDEIVIQYNYVFLDATFFFPINAFRGFSKYYKEKKRAIQSQVRFFSLLKSLVLCSLMNLANNLVNNVPWNCWIFWHKVKEIFLVLGEKEK